MRDGLRWIDIDIDIIIFIFVVIDAVNALAYNPAETAKSSTTTRPTFGRACAESEPKVTRNYRARNVPAADAVASSTQ